MGRWERYLHDNAPDKLVKLAIIHAEFEALHPFLDGNGRLGRMLVPLFLWQQGLIRALFREHTLLIPIVEGSGRRAAVLVFRELINIAEGRPAF